MSEAQRSSHGRERGPSARVRAHRSWLSGAVVICTVGILFAIGQWGWAGPLAGTLTIAVVVGALAACVWGDLGSSAVPRIIRVGLLSGLAATAATGLVGALGITGLVLVLLLTVTSPVVTRWVRHLWRELIDSPGAVDHGNGPAPARPTRAELDVRTMTRAQDLGTLDDAALCLAWRRSFLLLEAAHSVADRMAVVEQRQGYLDELQRRYPKGLASWLGSGARASGNPLPYLGDHPRRTD